MNDVHALVGAYAVDALDDVERAAFERHLAECRSCQDEVRGLREAAARLAGAEVTDPPARLREQVLAGIEEIRPLPPLAHPDTAAPAAAPSGTPDRRRRSRPALLVAAAAAVVALGAGGAIVWQQVSDDTSQRQLSPTEQVLAAEDAERYAQQVDGAELTIVRSRSLNQAVLVASDMPEAPDGKVYELWLDHEGVGMVPAGLMTGEEPRVLLEGDPATAVGAGITVEPEGGSEKPTTPPMVTFAFDNA